MPIDEGGVPGPDGCCSYRGLMILLPPEKPRREQQPRNAEGGLLTVVISPESCRLPHRSSFCNAFHVLPFGRRGLAWFIRSDVLEQRLDTNYFVWLNDPATGCRGWVLIQNGNEGRITAAA